MSVNATNDESPDLSGAGAGELNRRGLAWLAELGEPGSEAGGDTNDHLHTLACASAAQAHFMAALAADEAAESDAMHADPLAGFGEIGGLRPHG